MTQYLISFDEGAMNFPEEDFPAVGAAAHAATREAMEAGVWVFGAGMYDAKDGSIAAPDGTIGHGLPDSKRYIGGMTIVDVSSREEALEWAGKFATACRCSQEVRELMADPAVYRRPATAPDPQ